MPDFRKANYQDLRTHLQSVNWEEIGVGRGEDRVNEVVQRHSQGNSDGTGAIYTKEEDKIKQKLPKVNKQQHKEEYRIKKRALQEK